MKHEPSARPLRARVETLLCCLAAVNLTVLPLVEELLYPNTNQRYFLPGNTPTSYLAALALMVGLTLLAWFFYEAIRDRISARLRYAAVFLFLGVVAAQLLDYLRRVFFLGGGHMDWLANHRTLLIGAFLLIVTAAVYVLSRKYRIVLACARAFLLLISPFGLINVVMLSGNAVASAASTQGLAEASAHAAGAVPEVPSRPKPRLVWLIMDELDYRVTFEARPPGLALPALDRLRSESFFATRAHRIGGNTLEAMPGLLIGDPVEEVRVTGDSAIDVRRAGAKSFSAMSSLGNVFTDLAGRDYAMGLIGFYHPYCRLFGALLKTCETYSFATTQVKRNAPLLDKMASDLWSATPLYRRYNLIETIRESSETAQKLSARADLDFVFMHLAPPHGPTVYDPRSGQFSATGRSVIKKFNGLPRYFNHLILADRVLGQLRRNMEQAGIWNNSVLIVSADHCWRGADRYDGQYDPRVPFIVKLRGQSAGSTYDRPFNSALTRSLVVALADGKIESVGDLRAWFDRKTRGVPYLAGATGPAAAPPAAPAE